MKKKILMSFFVLGAIGMLWWNMRPNMSSKISIEWGENDAPLFKAKVDGDSCFLELATSSKFFLVINEKGMELLSNKTPIGKASSRDILGNFYEEPTYEVKNLDIGTMKFSDLLAVKESLQHSKSGIVWEPSRPTMNVCPKASGLVGRPLLQKTNLLLDFGHDFIIPIENKNFLKREGFFIDSMQRCPIEPGENGLVVRMDTDIGPLRLDLNTGATVSGIRASLGHQLLQNSRKITTDCRDLPYFATELSFGKTIFGKQNIYLIDISDDITWCDGFLGIDFFRKHVVYIDYHDKAVYIGSALEKS